MFSPISFRPAPPNRRAIAFGSSEQEPPPYSPMPQEGEAMLEFPPSYADTFNPNQQERHQLALSFIPHTPQPTKQVGRLRDKFWTSAQAKRALLKGDIDTFNRLKEKLDQQNIKLNLKKLDLSYHNLHEANLTGVNLKRANLRYANLEGANLTEANLERANLEGINLTKANLERANLTEANLERASLYKANLTGINLKRANLSHVYLIRSNLTEANLEDTDLWGADLDSANLSYANLKRARLTYSWMSGAITTGANFEGCRR